MGGLSPVEGRLVPQVKKVSMIAGAGRAAWHEGGMYSYSECSRAGWL